MFRLRKFMSDRYGVDQYSMALLFLAAIIFVIIRILPKGLQGLNILGYVPLAMYIYRALSKDIYKRGQENYKYLRLKGVVLNNFKLTGKKMRELKDYKYFKCPQCSQKLRVPRRQGKITVTCPKCKMQFKGKS